jgi:hypothetical protein
MLVKFFFHLQLLTSNKLLPHILSFPKISIYVYHHPVPKHEGQFPLSHPALMHLSFQTLPFSDVIQLLYLLA